MALAIYRCMHAQRISYGELLRRAVARFIAGDEFHDFEANPVVIHSPMVAEDSAFDHQNGA